MPIDPQVILGSDRLSTEFESFLVGLAPTDEKTGRFYHIVTSIGVAALSNYRMLRAAFEEDQQTHMAWSCRNLLELAIFAKYTMESEPNALDFAADRLIDGLQMAEALKDLEATLNPALQSSPFDALSARFTLQIQQEGITRTSFKKTSDLASLVGLQGEYRAVNKVASKFVHPTAWALLTADQGSARFPDARELFWGCGALYFATVCAEFMPHIRQYGLRHKP